MWGFSLFFKIIESLISFFILFQNKNKDNKFESNDESLLKRFSTALKINQNLTKLGLRGL